nr:alpha/beta hydrolase [Kibdelosporangium sp. MJ126-NF4]CEL18454.1 probable exported protease [Kibdelosporangium sp. MJ126-NF4]CTQ97937.1 probable exported protease [EC:3.4.-.-] [Kibdelosporangium sp. MJ126-NF4]
MTRSLRKATAAVVSGTVLGGMLLGLPAEAGQGPVVPRIAWQDCGAEHSGFECATADVPLDHGDPHGPVIRLALTRKPATDRKTRIGTLFVNPGGPGASGVDYVFSRGAALSSNLGGRFDILGFDPRGIGESNPLRCFDTVGELNAFSRVVDARPYEPRDQRPYFDAVRSLAPKCLNKAGTIARHMSTADVVRDLDLLRRAVGDSKLSYLGFSYGTYIGSTYASMFPNTVRALVIDGVLDPALWSSGRQISDDRTNANESFEEMLRLCDAAGSACAFHSPGQSAKARWEKVADAVRAKPVNVDGTIVDYATLIGEAVSSVYSTTRWRDFTRLLTAVATAPPAETPLAARRQDPYPNGFDGYYGNVCADIEFPRSFREFQAVGRYAEAGSRLGPFWWWDNASCADWPVNQDRFTGPWKTRTSAPVLVVGNYFDGVTGYAGAKAAARNLKGSRLLSYAGWGHSAYSRNTCSARHIDNYLLTGTLPAEGTVCPANPNPFLDTTLTRADSDVPLPYPGR